MKYWIECEIKTTVAAEKLLTIAHDQMEKKHYGYSGNMCRIIIIRVFLNVRFLLFRSGDGDYSEHVMDKNNIRLLTLPEWRREKQKIHSW